jgi:thioredoxin 1
MSFIRANRFVALLLHSGLLLVQGIHQLRTHNEFLNLLTQSHDTLVIVDYFSHSCPPCKALMPVYERLSQEYAGVKFAKIDVFENGETTQQMGITSMPTFQFFLKGQMVHSATCTVESQLREVVAKFAQVAGKVPASCGQSAQAKVP